MAGKPLGHAALLEVTRMAPRGEVLVRRFGRSSGRKRHPRSVVQDLQSVWFFLLFCAGSRATCSLRVL